MYLPLLLTISNLEISFIFLYIFSHMLVFKMMRNRGLNLLFLLFFHPFYNQKTVFFSFFIVKYWPAPSWIRSYAEVDREGERQERWGGERELPEFVGRARERRRSAVWVEMGLLSNRVERSEIKPGDHIYTYRAVFAYSHHGNSSR